MERMAKDRPICIGLVQGHRNNLTIPPKGVVVPFGPWRQMPSSDCATTVEEVLE